MTALWTTILVGVGTYLTRASFIVGLAGRTVPAPVARALRNVGPAVLAALVASLLVGSEGIGGLAPDRRLVALAIAGVVAGKTRNVVWSLVAGMTAIWILNALL